MTRQDVDEGPKRGERGGPLFLMKIKGERKTTWEGGLGGVENQEDEDEGKRLESIKADML